MGHQVLDRTAQQRGMDRLARTQGAQLQQERLVEVLGARQSLREEPALDRRQRHRGPRGGCRCAGSRLDRLRHGGQLGDRGAGEHLPRGDPPTLLAHP